MSNISIRRDDSDPDVSVYTATTLEPGYSATMGRDVNRVVGRIGMSKPVEVHDEHAMRMGQLFRTIPAQVVQTQVDSRHLPYGSKDRDKFMDDSMDDAQKLYGDHPIPHAEYELTDPFQNTRQFTTDVDRLGTDVTKRRPLLQVKQFNRFSDGSIAGIAGEGYTQLAFPGMAPEPKTDDGLFEEL